ncbi:MAG: hypothetical protein ACKVU4_02185 [Phycisphaerales bacterium]
MNAPSITPEVNVLIREAASELPGWPITDEQVDALLDESTGDGYEASEAAERAARIVASLGWGHAGATRPPLIVVRHTGLFGDEVDADQRPTTPRSALVEFVRRAYESVSMGASTDLLIADPERNARFIQACWKLGAQASQPDLNWLLLNARKAGKIGKIAGVERFRVDPDRLDQFLFASELALRYMQDRAYFEKQRDLSLDQVLCDPVLASEFEGYARRLAPGFERVEYRWGALRIRKSLKRDNQADGVDPASFEYLGNTLQVKVAQLPTGPGFVWLNTGDADLYFSVATNVRRQVERMLQVEDAQGRVIPRWMAGDRYREVRLAIAPTPRLGSVQREATKALFVRDHEPSHNVLGSV